VYFPHIIRLMSLQDVLTSAPAAAAIDAASRFYDEMDRRLENAWLAGSYSYADIAFYMAALFGERQGAPITARTPRLLAWRLRMTQRPAVKKVVQAMAAWLQDAGRPVPAFMKR
jgi:glutathione S-transferase